jgi:hypothetical protein
MTADNPSYVKDCTCTLCRSRPVPMSVRSRLGVPLRGVPLFNSQHLRDAHDNPAGGSSSAVGVHIDWQSGPLAEGGYRNGAVVEEVIAIAADRIMFYQGTRFHCVENAVALGHLLAASEVLRERFRDRSDRGVEGTHQK